MNVYSILSIMACTVYLFLGAYTYRRDPANAINRVFGVLCASVAIWAFSYAFVYPSSALNDPASLWFWYRLSAFGWCTVPSVHLQFAMALTGHRKYLQKPWFLVLIYLPCAIFIYRVYTGVLLIDGFKAAGPFTLEVINSSSVWYALHSSYYILFILGAFYLIYRWGWKSAVRRERRQSRIILATGMVSFVLSFIANFLNPVMNLNMPAIAPILTTIWGAGMAVAIARYRLMQFSAAIASDKILDNIDNMIIMTDPAGGILITNPQVQSLLGRVPADLTGQAVGELLYESEAIDSVLTTIAENRDQTIRQEVHCRGSSAQTIPVRFSASAVRDRNQDYLGIVWVFHDLRETRQLQREITERKKAQESLSISNHQLTLFSKQLEQQNEELEAMSEHLIETNTALADINNKLFNILDNVEQGFLAFDRQLTVQDSYSEECLKIFGDTPAGKNIADLLYPDEPEERSFLAVLLHKIASEESIPQMELYSSLLPEEITLGGRIYNISFKKPYEQGDGRSGSMFIVVMADITDRRKLEAERDNERRILRMVVRSMINRDDILECINDYRLFCERDLRMLGALDHLQEGVLADITRTLHTFKGNLSQLELVYAPILLHQAETVLGDWKDSENSGNIAAFRRLVQQLRLSELLDQDLEIIRHHLGYNFFEIKERLSIEKEQLLAIERRMRTILPHSEFEILIPSIRHLRFKDFKELLRSYPEYAINLAARLGKGVNSFDISGDEILVDPDYFHRFTRSLVHVFRNIVDHGIEDMEERLAKGKEENGNINCTVELIDRQVVLTIADDGAGINVNKVKRQAAIMKLYSPEQLEAMTDDEASRIIFSDAFTTREEVSLISGRGQGLSAVSHELDKLGGVVNIHSARDAGMQIEFILPLPMESLVDNRSQFYISR